VQLRTGWNYFHDGFGDPQDPAVLRAMKVAWKELRDQVMEADRRHFGLFTRPWSWWRFDQKTNRPQGLAEQKKFLIENGLLNDEEKSALG
jgi:hypothetical protein